MSIQDKLIKGQVLLDDLNNYRPLDKQPMAETTIKKAKQLIKTLLSEGHIDKTTAKWPSLTPDPPQIPGITTVCHAYEEFYQGNPPVPTRFLSERLSMILTRKLFPI